jgi:hypothetical protein
MKESSAIHSPSRETVSALSSSARMPLLFRLPAGLRRARQDGRTIEEEKIPDGTGIGVGLAGALNMLQDSTAASRIVILLTDGSRCRFDHAGEAADLAISLQIASPLASSLMTPLNRAPTKNC